MNSNQKNIAYIESGLGFGGSPVSLYRLVKSLNRNRYKPYVVVYAISPTIEKIVALGIPVNVLSFHEPFPSPLPGRLSLLTRIRNNLFYYGNVFAEALVNGINLVSFFRSTRIDIVHLNNGILENLPGVFAARFCRIPCVSHIRGTEAMTKLERLFSRWVTRVITLNREMFLHYVSLLGSTRVQMIFNGVDLDSFKNPKCRQIRKEFNLRPDTFAIGTAARLVEGKGLPEFIKAAAEVIKAEENVKFFVIGDNPLGETPFQVKVRHLTNDLGLKEHLVFIGWRSDVIDVMSAMDIIVQVSTTYPEGMSLVPIEAMALSKPVIVSNLPGYINTVEHAKTGFIIPAGNEKILAQTIVKLVKDKNLTKQLGSNGKQKVLREFDMKIIGHKIQKIYDQVIL